MKREIVTWIAVVVVGVAIEGCTVVEQPKVATRMDVDRPARIVSDCDKLGFIKGSDSQRLCLLRGMDRYIDHQTVPLTERYMRVPECAQYPCSR